MKFSIITTTYNSDKYLKENIESVRIQSNVDYEHIFIDGFSSDKTVEIIEEYKKENPEKIKLFQFEPKGISDAMNKGVEKASGEYIIHMNSDDSFFDGDVLSDVAEYLNKNDMDWIYGKANTIEDDGKYISIYPNKPFFHYHDSSSIKGKYLMKLLTFVPHQAVFIKKSVFDKFGKFDEAITSKMDPDMWKRINYKTKWSFFDRVICNYRVREGAQSSDKKNYKENRKNLREIQKRHLNKLEYFLMNFVNKIQERRNKDKR